MSQIPQSDQPNNPSGQPNNQPGPGDQYSSSYQGGGQAPAIDPGKTLGVVGLVLAIVASVVGLIVSIIALRKSKKAGFKNGLALAGVIVGVLTTLVSLIVAGVVIYGTVTVLDKCGELGSGTHQVAGTTITCP